MRKAKACIGNVMSLNDITNDSIIQCKHKRAIGDLKLVADNVANTRTHYLVSHVMCVQH